MEYQIWLKDLCVFLAAAGVVVPLFHRARMGAVLAFLVVGVAVGPYGLARLGGDYPWIQYLTIEDRERVEPFAELGVMFLLFVIGLEMSFARLWSLRRFVLGVGGLQFVVTALAIGGGLAAFGVNTDTAVVLGLCLAMSSTAIVMELLEEQGRAATPIGLIAISVLLFQDLMVAPVLFGTAVLGRHVDGGNIVLDLAAALGLAVAVVAAIVVAGRFLLRPLFRFVAQTGSREVILAITVLTVVGVAALTGIAGMSTALGAFLAGLLLSETEYRHQVDIDLAPFKGLLLGLFFVTVGMTVDLQAVWAEIGLIVVLVAALLAVKAIVIVIAARSLGVGLGATAEVAVLLAEAGEFAFVVIALGRSSALLDPEVAQTATAVVGVSMMLTPLLALAGRRLGRALAHRDHGDHMPDGRMAVLENHVVIGGYGRVGQMVAALLTAENIPFVALDTNGELVRERRQAGHAIYFGDAGRPEFLQRVGAAGAKAFVATANSPTATERMVIAARKVCPTAQIIARAVDPAHAARLIKLGAVAVVPEAVEASLQLGARLLERLGLPDEAVDRRIEQTRERELGRLRAD